jgi:hypothetical protein
VVIALWFASVDLPLMSGNLQPVRSLLVPLTGILAINFIFVVVLLAANTGTG